MFLKTIKERALHNPDCQPWPRPLTSNRRTEEFTLWLRNSFNETCVLTDGWSAVCENTATQFIQNRRTVLLLNVIVQWNLSKLSQLIWLITSQLASTQTLCECEGWQNVSSERLLNTPEPDRDLLNYFAGCAFTNTGEFKDLKKTAAMDGWNNKKGSEPETTN